MLKVKTTKLQVVEWGAVTKTARKLSVQSLLSREDMESSMDAVIIQMHVYGIDKIGGIF